MSKKPKTPDEIAKDRPVKETYSFHLIKHNVEIIKSMAKKAGIHTSDIVDELIQNYLDNIKDKN